MRHAASIKKSPITGNYWEDARAPVGLTGAMCRLILDGVVAIRQTERQRVQAVIDAACTFASLPVLAYTGEEGLVVTQAYSAAKDAELILAPHIDEMFRMQHMYWRETVTTRDEDCYCIGKFPPTPVEHPICDYCKGTRVLHYDGLDDSTSNTQRAVRTAFVTTKLITKVTTTPHTSQELDEELGRLLDAALIETQRAGVSDEALHHADHAWRFFAVSKRMPTHDDEELFLAFQAAWETGNYPFAKQMVAAVDSS